MAIMARNRDIEVSRKCLAVLLALCVCMLLFHDHHSHREVYQTLEGVLIVDSATDEHASPPESAVPDASGEMCDICALMRQASLSALGYEPAELTIRPVIFVWPPRAAVRTTDQTEHYRPPIAVAV